MATGAKKYKIFKICKELNLGHETIINFLEQKKIKVGGPNAAVDEDIYEEILDKFATDREKAEKLHARKDKTVTDEDVPDSEKLIDEQDMPKSTYLEAIRKSIDAGVEAISKRKDEPEVKPKKKPVKPKKSEEPVVEKKKEIELPAMEEEEVAEEAKPEITPVIPESEPVSNVIDVKSEEIKPEFAEKNEKPLTEEEKKSKAKFKKHTKAEDESLLSEKELKRRKALEMVRKEKDSRKTRNIDYHKLGDEHDLQSLRRRKKKQKRKNVDLKEVQDTVKKTLASIDSKGRKPRRVRKIKTETGEIIEEKIITVTEFISANDLANIMDVSAAEIITKCLDLGLVVSINQRLELDTIKLLAEEYGYKVEEQYATEFIEEDVDEDDDEPEHKEGRAPIVTIMGHVDHGKTSLLDYIRESHIVDTESGGITQHIGAYEVEYSGKKITFLDTPGHEAFTAMRARGAQVTDIVILIIAADDAVMPQTDEALDHAKAAGVKIVIAINKIDKPGANSEKIKQQLAERNILVEDWGGAYQCAEISAKTGAGIPDLLEKILLEAEMLELKANSKRRATGFVIESRLDKGKGAIATVLIQNGTLKIGDNFIAGHNYGKVRAIFNDRDEKIFQVGPSQPAIIVGFMGVSQAGDRFIVMKDEKTTRELATKRQQLKREQDARKVKLMTLDKISERIKAGVVHDLQLIVKADVDGSAEALADSLIKLNTSEVRVNVVRKAVGPISESDVLLASASDAVIVGFHVRANAKARELAEKEEVDIRLYQVIYDAINDIKLAMEGMLAPEKQENTVGSAEVREIFKISRLGTIAGCHVINGKINRNNKIRLVRDDMEIYSGTISSLKRFKEDVREVQSGFECGIQVENYNDLKIGDIIEAFEISEIKRQLK
ncbi:MAG: translation initiation factor IF-2 [Calditrichaceae bacterium]|nr:translation initiation factor IF-2 [Calditrichaceae bacterium]